MRYALDTAAATERIAAAGVDPAVARAIVSEIVLAAADRDADPSAKANLETAAAEAEVRRVKLGIGLVLALALAWSLFSALRH